MTALSAGAAALSISLLGAAFLILALMAWHHDRDSYDEQLHHDRLLEELANQPHQERDEP